MKDSHPLYGLNTICDVLRVPHEDWRPEIWRRQVREVRDEMIEWLHRDGIPGLEDGKVSITTVHSAFSILATIVSKEFRGWLAGALQGKETDQDLMLIKLREADEVFRNGWWRDPVVKVEVPLQVCDDGRLYLAIEPARPAAETLEIVRKMLEEAQAEYLRERANECNDTGEDQAVVGMEADYLARQSRKRLANTAEHWLRALRVYDTKVRKGWTHERIAQCAWWPKTTTAAKENIAKELQLAKRLINQVITGRPLHGLGG